MQFAKETWIASAVALIIGAVLASTVWYLKPREVVKVQQVEVIKEAKKSEEDARGRIEYENIDQNELWKGGRYVNEGGGYSINVPRGWYVYNESKTPSTTIIGFLNPFPELSINYVREDRIYSLADMKISVGDMSQDDFDHLIMDAMADSRKNDRLSIEQIDLPALKKSDLKAYLAVNFSGNPEGGNAIASRTIYVYNNNKKYELLIYSEEVRTIDIYEYYRGIIDSFEILPQN
ncbi:MAG: hypothetical protein R3A44_25975 [Caldilineaceae bacterium]